MSYHRQEMFYENPSHTPNPPHRMQPQGSHLYAPRPVDSAANSVTGFQGSDDPNARFDAQRYNDRMNPAGMHGNYAPYDMPQPWNGGAYGGGSIGGPMGGTNRMKPPSRGRNALPSVSRLTVLLYSPN